MTPWSRDWQLCAGPHEKSANAWLWAKKCTSQRLVKTFRVHGARGEELGNDSGATVGRCHGQHRYPIFVSGIHIGTRAHESVYDELEVGGITTAIRSGDGKV